ncbi:inositol-pentakisphosphate 2-kinase [Chytriomyces cf. hyalinus JEL632]|nr:inositol-pentakisphosphate 2-kinase [Chytriomyces cf. hyalinus JEL632]
MKLRGEGNKHVVVCCTESVQRELDLADCFSGAPLVIRLSKCEGEIPEGAPKSKSNLDLQMCYGRDVVAKLLGAKYSPMVAVVQMPESLKSASLVSVLDSQRLLHRRTKNIDFSLSHVVVMEDHAMFDNRSSERVFAVEIKPKWGFIPSHAQTEMQSTKRTNCRFCMHSLLKAHETPGFVRSAYCPMDLFSRKNERIVKALRALRDVPGNNLRVFLDGDAVPSDSPTLDLEDEFIKTMGKPRGPIHLNNASVWGLIASILEEESILKDLALHQKGLDSAGIAAIWATLHEMNGLSDVPAQPSSLEEWNLVISTYLSRAAEPSGESLSLKTVILEHLISASLKDCSIMITFRKCDSLDSNQDRETLKEYHGTKYQYKIRVLDVDIKHVSKLSAYFSLDQRIRRNAETSPHGIAPCF